MSDFPFLSSFSVKLPKVLQIFMVVFSRYSGLCDTNVVRCVLLYSLCSPARLGEGRGGGMVNVVLNRAILIC